MKLGLGLRLGAPESEETLGIAGQLDPLTCACVLAAFTPLNISGITAWLDSRSGVVLSGSNVTSWTDSVNGNVYPGGAAKPTINASNAAFLGIPTLHWSNALNQTLTSSVTVGGVVSYFVVFKCDDQSNIRTIISPGVAGQFVQLAATNGVLMNAGVTGVWGTSPLTGAVRSLVAIINGVSSQVWVDGVQLALASGSANVGPAGNPNMVIGYPASPFSFQGDIADIIMWSGKAVTAQDVADLHAWAQRNCGAV